MDEKILRRVRALSDIASRESTPEGEREAAMQKAMELMALYGITQAHLVSEGKATDEIGRTDIAITDPYSYPKVLLVHNLAEALRCKAIITKQSGKRYQRVAVIGAESDRERVEFLYTSLLVQALRGLARVNGYSAADTKVRRSNYLRGFGFRAGERLKEIERATIQEDAATSGTGAELVLLDRSTLVERAYRDMFPDAHKTKSSYRRNNAAWSQGTNDANRADLGQSRVGGGRRELTAG